MVHPKLKLITAIHLVKAEATMNFTQRNEDEQIQAADADYKQLYHSKPIDIYRRSGITDAKPTVGGRRCSGIEPHLSE
jgi:hypothetical protein